MWELTKHHKPTVGEQPTQPGQFTEDFPAVKYVHEALTSLFQLSPAHTLNGLAESYPAAQWLLAINRAQARHTAKPSVLLQLLAVSPWVLTMAHLTVIGLMGHYRLGGSSSRAITALDMHVSVQFAGVTPYVGCYRLNLSLFTTMHMLLLFCTLTAGYGGHRIRQ